MAEPIFTLNDVSYSYPGKILGLANINLTINASDRIAIIGANGTGKSTLLHLLDALIYSDKGTFTAFGKTITKKNMDSIENQRSFRSKVGFVFQNPDIQLFCPTVKDDILFGPLQLLQNKEAVKKQFDMVVSILKIEHLLHRSPFQLSIGEKKKVAIASVLIMQPQILLLDEPTAGLDPQTVRDIISVLYTAHHEGKTIVMATHDLHIVEELADKVSVFGTNHTIIRSCCVSDILTDHDFLQQNNLMHIHIHSHGNIRHSHVHNHGTNSTKTDK